MIEAAQPPITEAPAPPPEPQRMVIEMPSSPQPNAAEQLRRDMEAAASPPPEPVPPPVPAEAVDPSPQIIEMPEPRQQPTAAELLRQEMAAPAPQQALPPQAPKPPAAQQPPEPQPTPVSAEPPEAHPRAPAQAPGFPAGGQLHRAHLSDVPFVTEPGPLGIRLGSIGPGSRQRQHHRYPPGIQTSRCPVHPGSRERRTEHRCTSKQILRCHNGCSGRGPVAHRVP